jgi:hypothetical protein
MTAPQREKPDTLWSTVWLLCGLICLVPSAFLTWAFFAHIIEGGRFSSGSGLAIVALVFVPLYGWFLAGPIAIVGAGWALRFTESQRWRSTGLWGGVSTVAWSLLLLGVDQPGAGTVAIIGPMGFASLVVVGSAAWKRRLAQGRSVA